MDKEIVEISLHGTLKRLSISYVNTVDIPTFTKTYSIFGSHIKKIFKHHKPINSLVVTISA